MMMEVLCIFIVVVVTWLYICQNTYTCTPKGADFAAYKLKQIMFIAFYTNEGTEIWERLSKFSKVVSGQRQDSFHSS